MGPNGARQRAWEAGVDQGEGLDTFQANEKGLNCPLRLVGARVVVFPGFLT